MQEINNQKKNLAISSYFLILFSGVLLLIKSNPNFKDKFVRNHTKVAFLLHIAIFGVIILFLFFRFFNFFAIYNFNLNELIASFLLLWLFSGLFYGIYKASKGETIKIKDFNFFNKKNQIVSLENNLKITEKGIFSIILAHIPFLGFLVSGKIKKGSFLNIIKLNTYFTLFLIILYINSYYTTANILFLLYIIFVVFTGVMLVINRTFIKINLEKLPTFRQINSLIKIFFIYVYNYLKGNFKEFNVIKKEYEESQNIKNQELLKSLEQKKDLKINKNLIYIPFLNFIFIFFLNTKYKIHIINSLLLTFLLIIFIILDYYQIINKYYYLLIIFGIFYGIGNLKNLNYKFPFLYDFYEFFSFIKEKIKKLLKIFKQKQKEVKQVSYKPKD